MYNEQIALKDHSNRLSFIGKEKDYESGDQNMGVSLLRRLPVSLLLPLSDVLVETQHFASLL